MGRLFGSAPMPRRALTLTDAGVPGRMGGTSSGQPATPDQALRLSSVWAALRLRSDLISTLPVDVYRRVDGRQVQAPASRLFRRPAEGMLWHEWLQATQMDLDRYGNCFGQIVERDQAGFPVQVELWPGSEVAVMMKGRIITGYRYGGKTYSPVDVWHERQYRVAGLPVGLSPLAYAAWTVGGGLSAQSFALDWFTNSANPSGTLRHTMEANLPSTVMTTAKERFKVATANRDLFVTGKEWEFSPAAVDANSAQFLEQQDHTAVDVARYIGVPASAIDAAVSGQALTYANLTMKQLDLLVNYLAAPVIRRELALTANALPAPRFVKFNSDALLRMDPAGRTDLVKKQIDSWVTTPDEGRELLDKPPLTADEIELLQLMKSSRGTSAADEGTDQ